MGCPIEDDKGDELILAYGANTLTPQQHIDIELHLGTCANCRERAEAQRAVWTALDTWQPTEGTPDFDERLFRRIANEGQNAWWRQLSPVNWPWRSTLPVAVACSALIAAFLLKNPALGPEVQTHQPKLQIEQVEHALDDMDMLKQLSIESAPDKANPSEKI
jgi:hypothetical protein